jgi:hypothetical protein
MFLTKVTKNKRRGFHVGFSVGYYSSSSHLPYPDNAEVKSSRLLELSFVGVSGGK